MHHAVTMHRKKRTIASERTAGSPPLSVLGMWQVHQMCLKTERIVCSRWVDPGENTCHVLSFRALQMINWDDLCLTHPMTNRESQHTKHNPLHRSSLFVSITFTAGLILLHLVKKPIKLETPREFYVYLLFLNITSVRLSSAFLSRSIKRHPR